MKKFYAVVGNPPYQTDPELGSTRALPIYDQFMSESYKVADKVELITPGRFLFDAGQTKKEWNRQMLNDPHLKVLSYEPDSSKVFSGTDIKGGVAITYHDTTRKFKPIGTFIALSELRSIVEKAGADSEENSLASIADSQNNYDFENLYKDHPDYMQFISGEGRHSQLKSNALVRVPIFTETKQNEDDLRIFGLVDGHREYRFCPRRYIRQSHSNLMKYKVLVPKSNGSGALGEVLSTPLVGEPLVGYTQSFIGIGATDSKVEAEAILKYVKSRFARVLLGVLKITQDNPPATWRLIPLQDFAPTSDIDWSKPISDIDQQLYRKYGLSEDEIAFIESHVKEMA